MRTCSRGCQLSGHESIRQNREGDDAAREERGEQQHSNLGGRRPSSRSVHAVETRKRTITAQGYVKQVARTRETAEVAASIGRSGRRFAFFPRPRSLNRHAPRNCTIGAASPSAGAAAQARLEGRLDFGLARDSLRLRGTYCLGCTTLRLGRDGARWEKYP